MKKVILNIIYWVIVFSVLYLVFEIGLLVSAISSFVGFLIGIFSPTELIKTYIAKFTKKILGIKEEKDVY